MKLPRASKASEALLRSLLPEGKEVSIRPMFGNLSAFVNGNMFAGVFGEDFFVRLSEPDRGELLAAHGASVFEPMAGRQMKDYVVVPRAWQADPSRLRPWIAKAFASCARMPPKEKKR